MCNSVYDSVQGRESQPAKHDVCNDVDDSGAERASQMNMVCVRV